MERKLVSVQRVDHLEPIAGADNIQKARVMGWDVVAASVQTAPALRAGDAPPRQGAGALVLARGPSFTLRPCAPCP